MHLKINTYYHSALSLYGSGLESQDGVNTFIIYIYIWKGHKKLDLTGMDEALAPAHSLIKSHKKINMYKITQ